MALGRLGGMLRTRLAALAGAAILALSGCASSPAVIAPTSGGSGSAVAVGAELVEPLQQSLTNGDRSAFLANFAPGDAIISQGLQLFDNLRQLQDVSFSSVGQTGDVSVTWRVPGDRSAATQVLALTLGRRDGRAVITSLRPGPSVPIWLLGDTVAHSSADGTVLALRNVPAAQLTRWERRLAKAADAVSASRLGTLDDDWNGDLVIELPTTPAQFRVLSGESGGGAAAVTVCGTGSPRIVINPTQLDEDAAYLDALLVHEAVHVATKASCQTAGPMWLREGLAEWVAVQHSPRTRDYDRDWVEWHLARGPIPEALPAEADFDAADPDRVLAAYALSQVAVDVAVRRLGQQRAMSFLAEFMRSDQVDPQATTQLTGWYRAALRRIAASG